MAAGGEGAEAHAMGHGARQSFYLRDLEEQGISFYSLSVKQTIHRGLAAVAWSSWSSTAAHDLDWASPASRWTSKASPRSPQASLWFNSFGGQRIELVWQLSSCDRVWGLQDEIQWVWAAIYRAFGSISWKMHSPMFSIYKLNSNSALIEWFHKGDDSRVCFNMETRLTGRVSYRHGREGWVGPARAFRPKATENRNSLLDFQIFYNFANIFKFKPNLNFDNFYSHNKIQEHFIT
jgi:hypothetical protein